MHLRNFILLSKVNFPGPSIAVLLLLISFKFFEVTFIVILLLQWLENQQPSSPPSFSTY